MKYKVGDRVRVRGEEAFKCVNYYYFPQEVRCCMGEIVTIASVLDTGGHIEYTIKEDSGYFSWTSEMFEGKVDTVMTKSDLKTGMIVTTETGQEYWVMKNNVSGIDAFVNIKTGGYNNFTSYTEGLNSKSSLGSNIIKIEIPHAPNVTSRRTLLWRREEVKKVTMKEVEEKFGCKVKIVAQGE